MRLKLLPKVLGSWLCNHVQHVTYPRNIAVLLGLHRCRASDVPGTAPGAAAATATANQAQAQHAGDPLETFRRHLQEQLGEARHDDLDAAANSLAELFPLEALMNLGAGHDDDDDEHHDGEEENEEEEEEGDEEEGDEEEEEEDAQGQGGAVMPDSLRF